MAPTRSGQAAEDKAAKPATTSTDTNTDAGKPAEQDPSQPRDLESVWAEEQRLAHEAQQKIAQRTPVDAVPDMIRNAQKEQLSDWEKLQSSKYPDDNEAAQREELFRRSALTPAEREPEDAQRAADAADEAVKATR